jgi:GAF domain-containing protein
MSQQPQPETETTVVVRGGAREPALADLFVALADTLVDDFDVVELLDRLVHSCVELFDVTASGLLLLDGQHRLQLVASTSERAEELEVFQVQADEGPCLDCARTTTPVAVPDLQAERDRWPRFSSTAANLGFRAVHAVPLRLRSEALGALNLFHTEPTALPEADLHVVQALADVATIGILQQRHLSESSVVADQLQTALASRVAIEQAKGIIAESGDINMTMAFAQLRRYSRDRNLRLSDVASAIANRELAAATIINETAGKLVHEAPLATGPAAAAQQARVRPRRAR